jgi:hypothetical protein
LLAFIGVWPQHVLDAFEVQQRATSFSIDKQDIMLTTVNALSFPLYVLPFGGVIAKLGEYLNQCPIYMAGRGFSFSSFCITLTYFAEYVLVLIVSAEALTSAEQGLADTHAEAEDNADGRQLVAVLSCLFAIMLIRFIVGTVSGCSPTCSHVAPEGTHDEPAEKNTKADDADETNSSVSQTSLETITNSTDNTVVVAERWHSPV